MTDATTPNPVPVTVIIRDPRGAITQRRHIDHNNRDDRHWMGKAAYWAMRNAHSMETVPGHVEVSK